MGSFCSDNISCENLENVLIRTFHEVICNDKPFSKVKVNVADIELNLVNKNIIIVKRGIFYKTFRRKNDGTQFNFGNEYISIRNSNFIIDDGVFTTSIPIPKIKIGEILHQKHAMLPHIGIENNYDDVKALYKIFHSFNSDEWTKHLTQRLFEFKSRTIKYDKYYTLIENPTLEKYKHAILYKNIKNDRQYILVGDLILFTRYEFALESDTKITICHLTEETEKIETITFSNPEDKYIPGEETIIVNCQNNEKFKIDKNLIKFLDSEFLNNQLENENEISLPIFTKEEINCQNLVFLDYIDSKLYGDFKNYQAFLAL